MCIEEAIKEVKCKVQVGARIDGEKIIALLFFDDIAICLEKKVYSQISFDGIEKILWNY